jgi:protein CpxP
MKTSHLIALGMIAAAGIGYSTVPLAHEHGQMNDCRSEKYSANLAKLKTELKLTAAQEPAWNNFEKTVKEQMGKHRDHQKMAEGTDRMQAHIDFMEQRLAGMKAIQTARANLYKELTPEQKVIFDKQAKSHHPHHS